MLSIKNTELNNEVQKEINYSFGNIFIFDGFVVSEINEGVSFSWEEHAKKIIDDVIEFTNSKGDELVLISHRIHSYSVKPTGWLQFFRSSLNLKGYGIVCFTGASLKNTAIENLFFKKRIRHFGTIESAVQWATSFDIVDVNSTMN
ncbi:hypothetical protein [Winogradskyella helgolandensis]|uniref:hypothetical protein n=1 Tax=Winogradskyella helgolandensis TaxID=2697010 RepID=UPI0015BD2144|nr:hypothetical protein [Winogradskyella helgolandensis]